jgi:hypothetical protein
MKVSFPEGATVVPLRSLMKTLPCTTATAMKPRLCRALSDEFSCQHNHTLMPTYILGTMADQTATVIIPSFCRMFARHRHGTSRFMRSFRQTFSIQHYRQSLSLLLGMQAGILGHTSYPLPFDRRFSPLYGAYFGPKQCFRQRLSGHLPVSPFLRLGISWLSFSRSRFSRDARTWSRSGFDCRQSEGSPHRHTFSEPTFTSRPEARGRISSRFSAVHRLRNMTAPTPKHRGLSVSPPFLERKRYRIERQDYSDSLFWDTKPEPTTGLR